MCFIFFIGGNEIQKECTEHVRRNGKLSEGEIFCSKPGTLSCKMIVHACGPIWKGGINQESDHLTECVQSALDRRKRINSDSGLLYSRPCAQGLLATLSNRQHQL